MAKTFLALYRGPSIGTAELVGVSTDPRLVADAAAAMLGTLPCAADQRDPVQRAVTEGKRRALRLVAREVHGEAAALGPRPESGQAS